MIKGKPRKREDWAVVAVLWFVVGLAVIPILALSMSFSPAPIHTVSWEGQVIGAWVIIWPIGWLVLVVYAEFEKRWRKLRADVSKQEAR